MNADRLLEYYERIADAPDAIIRLRRFILDLAVRGKLVPQDPNDEPGSELLKRIAREKARLAIGRNAKHLRSERPVALDDISFEIPNNWCATRLAFVAVCLDYMRRPINSTEREQRIADKAETDLFPYFGATQQQGWIDDYLFDEKLVLLGEDGAPFFDPLRPKAYLISGKTWVNNHAHVFRAILVSHAFLALSLNAFDYRGRVVGATRSKLNQAQALDIPVILPPLAEQHRIVAKVDELIALCDRLEAAQAEREAARHRLATASLARLNTSDSAILAEHARFAMDNLTAFTTGPDQIKQLRRTILGLALSGRLSESGNWPSSPIRLGDVASLQNGYAFKSEWFTKAGTRLLRNANVGHGILNWADEVRIPDKMVAEYVRFRLHKSDIVLSLDRPFIVTGTKVARVNAADLPALLLQRVGRFLLSDSLDSEYLFMWINSGLFSDQIDPGRSNGVPHISSKQVEAAGLFVPSVVEQRRVVAKVDRLLGLCERLEVSLTRSDNARGRLLDALLAEALTPPEDTVPAEAERLAAHG